MVDLLIGGKIGLDLNEGKNLIGVYKNLFKVLIDFVFLDILFKVEYKNGLVEVLKYGFIGDFKLYEYLKVNDKLILNEIKCVI